MELYLLQYQCGSKSYDLNYRGILTRTMDSLLEFYIVGQNPTYFDYRGILNRTMDTLLRFYNSGQNPTRVKITRNRPLHFEEW